MYFKVIEFNSLNKMLQDALRKGNLMFYHMQNRVAHLNSFDFIKKEQDIHSWNQNHPDGLEYEFFELGRLLQLMVRVKKGHQDLADFVLNDANDGSIMINMQDIYLLNFLPYWITEQLKTMNWQTLKQQKVEAFEMDVVDIYLERLSKLPGGNAIANLLWETYVPDKYFHKPAFLTAKQEDQQKATSVPILFYQLAIKAKRSAFNSKHAHLKKRG